MNRRILALLSVLASGILLVDGQLQGQAPAPAQGMTYEEARTAMDAAEAEARANGWNVTIIVADPAGVPLYLRRFGGAQPRSYQIATAKILTVLGSGMSTGEYAAALAEGRIEPIEGAVTFEGGYLIRRNGEIIGAIAASGVRGSEDAQIVRAGIAAIGATP
jgi:glc operon protein GlcG